MRSKSQTCNGATGFFTTLTVNFPAITPGAPISIGSVASAANVEVGTRQPTVSNWATFTREAHFTRGRLSGALRAAWEGTPTAMECDAIWQGVSEDRLIDFPNLRFKPPP